MLEGQSRSTARSSPGSAPRSTRATAVIRVDGKRLPPISATVYLVLNKPRGVVSTMRDPEGRRACGDLVADRPERLFHVGRLDTDTAGLIILTNDGDFAQRLAHPSFEMDKTYVAEVEGELHKGTSSSCSRASPSTTDRSRSPGRGSSRAATVGRRASRTIVELVIHEGRNRIVRRLLEHVGHPVTRADPDPDRSGRARQAAAGGDARADPGRARRAARHRGALSARTVVDVDPGTPAGPTSRRCTPTTWSSPHGPGVHVGMPSTTLTFVLPLGRAARRVVGRRPDLAGDTWASVSGRPRPLLRPSTTAAHQRGIQLALTTAGARVLFGVPAQCAGRGAARPRRRRPGDGGPARAARRGARPRTGSAWSGGRWLRRCAAMTPRPTGRGRPGARPADPGRPGGRGGRRGGLQPSPAQHPGPRRGAA